MYSSLVSLLIFDPAQRRPNEVGEDWTAAGGVPACAAFEPEVLLVQVQVDGPVDVAESGRVAAERCCVR